MKDICNAWHFDTSTLTMFSLSSYLVMIYGLKLWKIKARRVWRSQPCYVLLWCSDTVLHCHCCSHTWCMARPWPALDEGNTQPTSWLPAQLFIAYIVQMLSNKACNYLVACRYRRFIYSNWPILTVLMNFWMFECVAIHPHYTMSVFFIHYSVRVCTIDECRYLVFSSVDK